jgi:NAD(P)-dependent dehydrogenase (short-subunit alcohol dehydrogenase family)
MPNLTGKTALVAGASRGMGRARALALARGIRVVLDFRVDIVRQAVVLLKQP